ncbi:MAG: DUF2304 domain-containing protein [bacterium]|jgi:FtsZ-binding cell division protein ZapB
MAELFFPSRQGVLIIICGSILLFTVINLIRNRRLLEQYGILWIAIGIASLFAFWLYPLLLWFTNFIGAGSTTSALLFVAVFVLLLINIQLSIKISEYAYKIKDIVQSVSILQYEIQQLKKSVKTLEKEENLAPSVIEERTPAHSLSDES